MVHNSASERMLRAIIFDLDGVLLESTEAKTLAFRKLFADYPQRLSEIIAYHESHGGVSRFEKFRHIYAQILREPLSAERFAWLCTRYSELALSTVLNVPLVPGAAEFLREFHRHMLLFVVSGTPTGELQDILDRRGLMPYVQKAFGSPGSKPEIVAMILSEWSLACSDVLLVGDSDTDLDAAEQNGIPFIGRVHPGSPDSWRERSDLTTIKDLAELRARVDISTVSRKSVR